MSVEDFARAIGTERRAKKLTQEQAANAVGVSVHSWRAYERGATTPPLEVVHAMTRVLGARVLTALVRDLDMICRTRGYLEGWAANIEVRAMNLVQEIRHVVLDFEEVRERPE